MRDPMQPALSIVIPAWNESHRLVTTMERLHAYRGGVPFEVEVLIVVEPGQDNTLELAQSIAKNHPGFEIIGNDVHLGKGHAVRTGMLRARGDFIFYMDADLSVPLEEIHPFMQCFAQDPEVQVIVGNRAHLESRITRRQSLIRQRMGQLFNRFLQSLSLVSLRDTQCGFKAFRCDAARAIFSRQQLNGFAFDVEVLLLAARLGLQIRDLPVEWINSPESKVHILRDSWRMLCDTIWLRRMKE